MKKFTLFTLIAFSAFLSGLNAQTPASATWTLLADPTASTTGSITASQQTLGSLIQGVQYNTGYGTAANNNVTNGWQRVATTSSIKVGSDTAFTQGGYVEYAVTPNTGTFLQVNTVSLEIVGGGTGSARIAAYYSRNGFATMDSFGVTSTYNALSTRATRTDSIVLINGGSSIPVLTGQQTLTFSNLAINVLPTQSFAVRIFVWLTGYSATVRHLGERNVTISGVTQTTAFPLVFSGQKAYQKNNGIQLDWTTATEVNVDKYSIEKSSNGVSFSEAYSILAKGNSTNANNYSWFDASPTIGNNYYRIKAIDKDGSAKYTSVLKVLVGKGSAGIVISPNPIKGSLINLQLKNLNKGIYTLRLVNSTGQQVYTSQLTHDGGSASQVLDIPGLNKGVYTLQISNGSTKLNNTVLVD